jgi:hypothetical protein
MSRDLVAALDRAVRVGAQDDRVFNDIILRCNDMRRHAGAPMQRSGLSGIMMRTPSDQKQTVAVYHNRAYAEAVRSSCRKNARQATSEGNTGSMFDACFTAQSHANYFRSRCIDAHRQRGGSMAQGNYYILPCLVARAYRQESVRFLVRPDGSLRRVEGPAQKGNVIFFFHDEGPIVPMVHSDVVERFPYGKVYGVDGGVSAEEFESHVSSAT